ncbi:MAG: hypothetical protein WC558_11840 [Patulibacter sp.]
MPGPRILRRKPVPETGTAAVTPLRAALEEERRTLAEEVAKQTWDLGGLAYEMAVRDHFRVDVISLRAAELQRVDARLSEVERLLADHAGIAGSCRFCGSPHGRSAEFCWNCGERLIVRTPASPVIDVTPNEVSDAPTAVHDAVPPAQEPDGGRVP